MNNPDPSDPTFAQEMLYNIKDKIPFNTNMYTIQQVGLSCTANKFEKTLI